MSSRATKWILLVLLPLLAALYASYPPTGVVVQEKEVVKKIARTPEEAREHDVAVGEAYQLSEEVTKERWLPLALGEYDTETRLVERTADDRLIYREIRRAQGRIKLGLDVAGGTELLYGLQAEEGERTAGEVANTIAILKQRIDPSNVKEYRIQAMEANRILIQVPAATTAEVEQLKRRLETMGKLEFRLAIPPPRFATQEKFVQMWQQAQEGRMPEGYVKMHVDDDPAKQLYLVESGEPRLTGKYLADVQPATDELGAPAVSFQLNAIGAAKFRELTGSHKGWALAIVLDGVLQSAPIIQDEIGARGRITGNFTQQEVRDIITVLRAGSLPMDIQLLQESTVGPQLGRDSIRAGITALFIAGMLVLAFIGLYYIGCGWVADGALIMNLVLLVGVMCVLGAALTLPGMAGILLTVGMAVDANVLIFERIREEQASGKGVRLALRNGYDRAFTTIVDANVTTLLTAAILYLVGTGPVRGFAITLSFGILLSMFTALVVTRLVFETFIEKEWLTEFKMFSWVGTPSINFSALRRPAYFASLVVIGVGIAALAVRGSRIYDIDFTGGTLVNLQLTEAATVADVRARLEQAGFERPEVQGVRTPAADGEGLTQFNVRIKGAGLDQLREGLMPQVKERLTAAGLMTQDDKLSVTADARGLLLVLDKPVEETQLRDALADLQERFGDIAPTSDEVVTDRMRVRLRQVSDLVDRTQVWNRMLRALAWAGLQTRQVVVETVEPVQDGAGVHITVDQPLQWQLLAVELRRRQFSELELAPAQEPSTEFTLTGPREVVERFLNEMPPGIRLQAVPEAQIDDATVTASLTGEFGERDIRSIFEKQGMGEIAVIPLGAPAGRWRMDLSYASIRDKLRTAFADLAQRSGTVLFTRVESPAEQPGRVHVVMELDEPMVLSGIRNYIEAADLGPYGQNIIVEEDMYSPEMLISEVTLSLPAEMADQIQARLRAAFSQPQPVQKIVTIGPTVAQELQGRALLAVIFASVIIVLYVAARFHAFKFGVAAVIALAHDVLITAGLVALADWAGVFGDIKLSLATLAAFLTILGYSLNDTIVVFDRIRENMGLSGRKRVGPDLVNDSINQTLSRTVLTSLTTLMVVVVLYLFGGSVLQGLALTLMIGVVVGTYSSMFIASPVLLDWTELTSGVGAFLRVLFLPVRLPLKLIEMAFGSGGS